jgi:hypothetical protein
MRLDGAPGLPMSEHDFPGGTRVRRENVVEPGELTGVWLEAFVCIDEHQQNLGARCHPIDRSIVRLAQSKIWKERRVVWLHEAAFHAVFFMMTNGDQPRHRWVG